jgi:hypothetical protein
MMQNSYQKDRVMRYFHIWIDLRLSVEVENQLAGFFNFNIQPDLSIYLQKSYIT